MGAQQLLAKILGVVLVLVGILGFVMDSPLLGFFGVNLLHNGVHLLTGLVFLWAGFMGGPAKKVNQYLGIVYVLVAILGFLGFLGFLMVGPGMDYDNFLHLAIGVITVLVGFLAGE